MKRSLVVALAIIVFFIGFLYWSSRKPTPSGKVERKIVVLSFGGAFADAQRAAYYKPFEQETGIKVEEASYDGEYGKLKAMVEGGNVSWDVADIEASALMRGVRENLYLPIDYSVINKSEMIEAAVHPYAVGADVYSVSLGWNTDRLAGKEAPRSWADFWDVGRFAGERTMKKDPRFTMEAALLADGVPLDQVYSAGGLDVDRAFRSLDKIKKYVRVWWTTGQQPIQLLGDGEVALGAAFGARIWIAKNTDKRPVDLTWNQSITDIEYWAVLRGAKQLALSMQFIAFATRADRQAEFSKHFPLGPANKKAFDFLESGLAKQLNTYPENFQKELVFNAKWWSENEEKVTERWNSWLLKYVAGEKREIVRVRSESGTYDYVVRGAA
jgi:putative spermidine/putrescine transport system substrate-binding protein